MHHSLVCQPGYKIYIFLLMLIFIKVCTARKDAKNEFSTVSCTMSILFWSVLRSATEVSTNCRSKDPNFNYHQLVAANSLMMKPKMKSDFVNFFDSHSIPEISEEKFIDKVLKDVSLRLGIILYTNSHHIGWLLPKNDDNFKTCWNVRLKIIIGEGVFLFGSLLNHSYFPNIEPQFVDGKFAYIVKVPIEKGQQLTKSYGWEFHAFVFQVLEDFIFFQTHFLQPLSWRSSKIAKRKIRICLFVWNLQWKFSTNKLSSCWVGKFRSIIDCQHEETIQGKLLKKSAKTSRKNQKRKSSNLTWRILICWQRSPNWNLLNFWNNQIVFLKNFYHFKFFQEMKKIWIFKGIKNYW